MYDFKRPFSFHFELTDKCNARCIQCSRNQINDKGEIEERPELCLTEITLDQYKNIFKDYQQRASVVLFCGNFGDPMFARDIFEITDYTMSNVLVPHTGIFKNYTNGGFRSKKWWYEYGKLLKGTRHLLNFSIDGLEETNHLYRVNVRYDRVIENAVAFMEGGGKAEWSFIRFGHNQHEEEEARRRAKELGFHQFTAVNTQRFYGKEKIDYKWRGNDYAITRYKPKTKVKKLSSNIDNHKKEWDGKKYTEYSADEINYNTQKQFDEFTKKGQSNSRIDSAGSIDCHVQKKNDIFIDAMGYLHPCCWIGSYEYHKMRGIFKPHMEYSMDNYLLDNRTYQRVWEKDFREILKDDWFEHILPLSWEVSPCMICTRQCSKHKFITVRQSEKI